MMQIELGVANEMLQGYEAIRPGWLLQMHRAGMGLFYLLAVIDFASTMTWSAIERRGFEEWASAGLRAIIRIGIFYTLLVFGADWIKAIVTTFQELGQRGAGLPNLTPDEILNRGINITWQSLMSASAWGILTNFAGLCAHIFSSIVAGLMFILIAIGYVVLMVEAFACLTCGHIFLAFGGSKWTVSYVERYIALAVSIGVKFMLFYFLIAVGMSLSDDWVARMTAAPAGAAPGQTAFIIMCQSLTFALLVWQVPKVFSAMMGGSPALTMGDMVSTSVSTVAVAIVAPYHVMTAAGRAMSGGGGSSAGIGGSSGRAGFSSPGGSGGGSSAAASGRAYVAPPSKLRSAAPGGGGGSGQSESVYGRGGSGAGRWAGRAVARTLTNDRAPAPSPPRLPMGDGDKE